MKISSSTKTCGLCQSTELDLIADLSHFKVAKCSHCKSGMIQELKDKKDENYSKSYELERRRDKPYICWELMKSSISDWGANTSILDVGCGTGDFLDIAKKHNFKTYGIEISEDAAAKAREKGHQIFCESIEDFDLPDKLKFDIIVMWDLLEHLHLPGHAMDILISALNKGGNLLILTPMMDSFYDKLGLLLYSLNKKNNPLLKMCWSTEHLFRFQASGFKNYLNKFPVSEVKIKKLINLSLKKNLYAGGSILPSWTKIKILDEVISMMAIKIARLFRLNNKLFITITSLK